MGPISTGLGEIYLWTVKPRRLKTGWRRTPTDLREIRMGHQTLRNVPRVTEINSIGGYDKEFLVAPNQPNCPPTV